MEFVSFQNVNHFVPKQAKSRSSPLTEKAFKIS